MRTELNLGTCNKKKYDLPMCHYFVLNWLSVYLCQHYYKIQAEIKIKELLP